MSIDPKILAKRALFKVDGLPALRGSPKQVKWATTIRADALALEWPDDIRSNLSQIVDSTWWIANKQITTTLKFKPPAPEQLADAPPASGRSTQPELSPTPAATPSAEYIDAMTPLTGAPPVAPRGTLTNYSKRLDDALQWAESVSRHPTLAHAAILATLSRLYKGEMQARLKAKAHEVMSQADLEVNRDLDAIRLMLSKP